MQKCAANTAVNVPIWGDCLRVLAADKNIKVDIQSVRSQYRYVVWLYKNTRTPTIQNWEVLGSTSHQNEKQLRVRLLCIV